MESLTTCGEFVPLVENEYGMERMVIKLCTFEEICIEIVGASLGC